MRKPFIIIAIVIALIFGVTVGRYSNYFTPRTEETEKKPLYWIDPMEPKVHYLHPGTSPMGMKLVPIYPEKAEGKEEGVVRISPALVNDLGVRTAVVKRGTLTRGIETVGYITPNENNISHINSYADGWVEKLIVKTLDEPVKKGQLLLQLYSPMLVNAQEEYLIALDSGNKYLIDASYQKLRAFRISDKQIQQLTQTRKANQLVNMYASQDGFVSQLNVREGAHVMPQTEMMSLVDLSNIWMDGQIFEDQISWVKVGDKAEARFPAFPGRIWRGEVDYIYPQVNSITRAVNVRFRFDNPGIVLKPNMYAYIRLNTKSLHNVISIPLEALIRASQHDYVVIALGDGRFDVSTVVSGIESGDQVQILSGLTPGEKVVVSGQYLIDSEANLKASFQRLEFQKGNQHENQKDKKP